MVTECPKCKKRYRISDSAIPKGGASVRCPNCSNIFTVYAEPLDIELIPIEEEVTKPTPEKVYAEPTTPTTVKKEEKIVKEVGAPPRAEDAKEILMRSFHEEQQRKPKAEVTVPEQLDEKKKKKHKKAQRLARSLAKDILLYHKDEVEIGRTKGNLIELLGDEIRRSWKFYKKQVGEDIINERNYFKEALNEIIAGGEEIFV